ncbi:MAG: putrescine/spermidine ABC transporter ATP-binding protein [Gammaproteobacteria bacterium GWF2_41_13]|nr:MAG: putrescine/spermidine ABC transporter ATP-binding protein [Gammaproteobacteria bacterium GWF2_41_13]
MAINDNVVEIRNLYKSFQDEEVLTNINLDIKQGEFLTLLGPSGCGKTTLLRLISGFETLSRGSITINGRSVVGVAPEHRHVNMVFQNYALFPHMTVFENIAFGLKCKKVATAEIEDRVAEILRTVKLEKLKNRKPHQLSGGQQQRVAIARAVVNRPLVLLLDEPLSALDYRLRQNMQIELKALQRTLGITFVLVTHDQEEALSMSDRVVVMNDGCIDQVGTPRNVYEKPSSLYVAKFVGETNIFTAEILAVNNKKMQVEIEGLPFTVNNDKDYQVGQKICIVVRPEDLRSWDNTEVDDTAGMIPATVEQVIYKGSTVDLILRTQKTGKRLSATEFFNEDDENLDFKLGESVWVEWMAGWEVVLPYEE